jgi:putative acetyltransferase
VRFGQAGDVIVRRETTADVRAARAVQVAAFRRPDASDEPVEARLLDSLRVCDGWIPALSIVVELDSRIVGHVVTTRAYVENTPALGLGPIGVLPSHQGRGIGLALMHATIGAADALGEPLIGLLGSPDYYRRFGFVASNTVGVSAPEPAWGHYFQVRTLTLHRHDIRGRFTYARPFDEM